VMGRDPLPLPSYGRHSMNVATDTLRSPEVATAQSSRNPPWVISSCRHSGATGLHSRRMPPPLAGGGWGRGPGSPRVSPPRPSPTRGEGDAIAIRPQSAEADGPPHGLAGKPTRPPKADGTGILPVRHRLEACATRPSASGRTQGSPLQFLPPLPGLSDRTTNLPTAHAVGYRLTPLPGLRADG